MKLKGDLVKLSDWEKTFWEDEKGNRVTIQDVLSALQDEPIVSLEVEPLLSLIHM